MTKEQARGFEKFLHSDIVLAREVIAKQLADPSSTLEGGMASKLQLLDLKIGGLLIANERFQKETGRQGRFGVKRLQSQYASLLRQIGENARTSGTGRRFVVSPGLAKQIRILSEGAQKVQPKISRAKMRAVLKKAKAKQLKLRGHKK